MDRVDQITTFVRVVELGGFAAAARDLARIIHGGVGFWEVSGD